MKNVLIILILFIYTGCQTNTTNKNKADKKEGTAKIELHQDFHNFGNLQAGETVAFSFKIKNSGNASLFIEKVETDCGCIKVEYPEEAIAPGKSDFMEVIFNSAGETGKVYKSITIFSNAENKEIKLAVAASVKNKMINLYSKI